MHEPHLRAADSDRAAVATTLGRAMSEGRLTVAEYDERLTRAYASRTFGELAELTADLPSPPRPAAPLPAPVRPAAPAACTGSSSSPWAAWLTTALIVLGVWAATAVLSSEPVPFWPIWVIGPWGAVLLIGTLTGARRRPGGGTG